MPIKRDKVDVKLEREEHDGVTYDVLYIDKKEIATFHLQNIDSLNLVHNNDTILEFLSDYLSKGQ